MMTIHVRGLTVVILEPFHLSPDLPFDVQRVDHPLEERGPQFIAIEEFAVAAQERRYIVRGAPLADQR